MPTLKWRPAATRRHAPEHDEGKTARRAPGPSARLNPIWDILNRVRCSRPVLPWPMKSSTYTTDYAHLLEELRIARVSTGMSQAQLADALGQVQSYVSKCEQGDRRLDVIELRNWVLALGGEPVAFMAALEDRIARHARLTEHRVHQGHRDRR